MKNVFYFSHINVIGGIEQFFAYLSEKYKDWDITIYYKTGDPMQIERLRRNVRVVKFVGQQIECDKAFFCFNTDIKNMVKAKETALVLHGDYLAMVQSGQLSKNCYIFNETFDKYYGVSKTVCDSWKQLTGHDCTLVYNPFIQKETKKILKLVYCGRLSAEKGGDLIEILVNRLDARNIDYLLYVYSNKTICKNNDKVISLHTRLDAAQFLNKDNFDYLLVPSKNEGYCYSLVQALANGLPVVATPCPVFKEIGVTKNNSITIAFDGKNVDEVIDKMLTQDKSFTYTPKEDTWNKILVSGKSTYTPPTRKVVKCTKRYFDLNLGTIKDVGDKFEVDEDRAKLLIKSNVVTYVEE